MIIDIHTHFGYFKLYPKLFLEGMMEGLPVLDKNKKIQLIQSLLNDKDGSKHLQQMDQSNIDKSVLLVIDADFQIPDSRFSLKKIYKFHYKILKQHPDRFIVFAGIDPRRGKKGLKLFEKGIYDYGFKGLKLYPPLGFSYVDEIMAPYYEICNQHHLPVLIHTGNSMKWMKNEFADPKLISQIAIKYRNINFILAHAGCQLTPTLVDIINSSENIYVDISGYRNILKDQNQQREFCHSILKTNVYLKTLFGSDWPLFNLFSPLYKDIEVFSRICIENNLDLSLLNKIFSENAKAILT